MSSKRAATGTAANGRAQRPRYSQPNQPDLPEITGVPPDLAPLLVEALKSATKFFSKESTPQHPFQEHHEETQQQPQSVVDSILNRMEATDEKKAKRKRFERMNDDRESWLNAVKRKAKDSYKGSSSTVPLACFRYLWVLGQEHGRVAVRRASLNLCGTLLLKSADCRMFVSSDDETLLTFVTCVVEAKDVKASSETQVPCWQAEALEWLAHLSESHGHVYPKFCVASQFLQQRCTVSVTTEGNSGANMPDLRRIREIAIKYGDREIEKVDKLIQRAHKHLDLLVPRMGFEHADASTTVTETKDDEDEDDDDDIDWEDGDEEFDETEGRDDHAYAVERTLAAMASCAGGLQGGHIEINLESNEDDESSHTMDENARKLLQKIVQSIEVRHMKRLSSWVDALIKADGLVLREKSLVIMSAEESKKRAGLLQKLLDKKQTLASILASAAKLGVIIEATSDIVPSEAGRVVASTNTPPQRQSVFLATAARRRNDNKVSRRRSTKLQIKYRTS